MGPARCPSPFPGRSVLGCSRHPQTPSTPCGGCHHPAGASLRCCAGAATGSAGIAHPRRGLCYGGGTKCSSWWNSFPGEDKYFILTGTNEWVRSPRHKMLKKLTLANSFVLRSARAVGKTYQTRRLQTITAFFIASWEEEVWEIKGI